MMTQVVIENLDPNVIEKLKVRAQRQGRTLEAELKVILEMAAEGVDTATLKAAAWERVDKARSKYVGQTFTDSVELWREDRQR
jgi:plasmid stability protein